MNTHFFAITTAICLGALAAGCASVDSRMQRHRAAFDSWPADVQQKVRAGQVALGFAPEMVRVALGEPGRVLTRTTEQGEAEVWVYYDSGPRFSFGIGVGAATRHGAYAGGVGVGDGDRDEETLRVVFEGGRVAAIETPR